MESARNFLGGIDSVIGGLLAFNPDFRWLGAISIVIGVIGLSPLLRSLLPLKFRIVPLTKAARLAHRKLENLTVFRLQERFISEPEKIPGMIALLLIGKDGAVEVFGYKAPFGELRKIPSDKVKTYMISDDAMRIYDQFNPKNSYHKPSILKSDLQRRIRELVAQDGDQ